MTAVGLAARLLLLIRRREAIAVAVPVGVRVPGALGADRRQCDRERVAAEDGRQARRESVLSPCGAPGEFACVRPRGSLLP